RGPGRARRPRPRPLRRPRPRPLRRPGTSPPSSFLCATALTEQVQALQRDKEILKTNLNKAEEEVKLLFEENRALDEANKRLLCLLEKEQKHQPERKHSASNSTKK
uniref:Uncharacterized protein n=1 Tax=Aegilops tauschii subsp. strangulata TaxID=200361 RepID=A0A453MCY2_AEGTS